MNERIVGILSFSVAMLMTTNALAQADESTPPTSTAPPDVVMLKNGGLIRGTISEQDPDGEVVIVLMSGETRRFKMTDVKYAGPADGMPSKKEPVKKEPAGEAKHDSDQVPVQIEGAQDLTVHVQTGSATAYIGSTPTNITAASYSPICGAPCEGMIERGTYTMAVSRGTDPPIQAESTVTIQGPTRLRATYDSRSGIRTAGVLVLIGGILGGGALVYLSVGKEQKCFDSGFCSDETKINSTTMVLGGIVLLGGVLAGYAMMGVRDKAAIEVLPFAPSASTSGGRLVSDTKSTWKSSVDPGLTLIGRF